MNRFRNILFSPLGEQDNAAAIQRVSELAKQNDARVTLMGVVPEASSLQKAIHSTAHIDKLDEFERAAMSKRLAGWASNQGDTWVETVVESGNQALKIIDRVMTCSHDLVVVTTDEDRDDNTTIKRLLRKCPCPVWVVRPTEAKAQRVLAAINLDPEAAYLNSTIIQLAASLVEQFGGEMHVVHAWQLWGEGTLRSSSFIHTTPSEVERLLAEEKGRSAQLLGELLASSAHDQSSWQVHLAKGAPEDVVSQVIEESRINLLVVGTVARAGIQGVLIGNTAEKILEDVRCSVIVLKPPDFVSPLARGI